MRIVSFDQNGNCKISGYLDDDGNEIKRTPENHPYSYDSYIIYGKPNSKKNTNEKENICGVDSDRLYQWDYDKYNECSKKIFGNTGQYFDNRQPQQIEKFLRLYFTDNTIVLKRILQGCNVSNGFPYWTFRYVTSK
jgi:hypothetical protein